MATWYVDGNATGANNGTSWANAWQLPASMTGISPGDTVYFSGGPSGGNQSYNLSSGTGSFTDLPGFTAGTAGKAVTYQIGQDSAHNGIATFASTIGTATSNFLNTASNIIISGDAGDGRQHFALANMNGFIAMTTASNVTIAYVNGGNIGNFGDISSGNGIHFSNCYCKINYIHTDHLTQVICSGINYGDNSIDSCTFYVPHDPSSCASGTDCLRWEGSGFTISNNTIIGYGLSGSDGNHQDGWQFLGGDSHILCYGNTFIDCGNSAIFGDMYFGGISDIHVYNNLVLITDPNVLAGSPVGFLFVPDGGWPGPGAPAQCAVDNVTIMNNAIVDLNTFGGYTAIGLNNNSNKNSVWTNCRVENNVMINCAFGIAVSDPYNGGTTCIPTNNVFLAPTDGAANFASYATYGGLSNNLHLIASASLLIAQGLNESSFFSKDKDGNRRQLPPAAWDVGAYVYNLIGNLTCSSVAFH